MKLYQAFIDDWYSLVLYEDKTVIDNCKIKEVTLIEAIRNRQKNIDYVNDGFIIIRSTK